MGRRAQNSTETLFFSNVFNNSIRVLKSRMVINYFCVCQKVRVPYEKRKTKFDILIVCLSG